MRKIKTADYIMQYLIQLGIKEVFGVPGDYNFNLVDAVEKNTDLKWIGCTNELNAGYTADGYARIKSYGALITTFGVGELSAINAVAGSFAESVPVVHIVGVPAAKYIKKETLLHHMFEHPDYYAFKNAYSNVVAATAFLNESNAKEEIDRTFSVLINEKKPVYIAVPVDVCLMEIENDPDLDIKMSDPDRLKEAVNHALELVESSKKPVIIAEVLTERFRSVNETRNFIQKSGYPVTTLLMGKGLIDEDYDMFLGTYLGKYGNENTYNFVNSSDCVISVGAIYSDMNTFSFDIKFDPSDFIQIFGTYTIVDHCRYDDVLMKDILKELADRVPQKTFDLLQKKQMFEKELFAEDKKLTSDYIYPRLQEFLKHDDVVFTETGIVNCGFAPIKLPQGANQYNQFLWGSIGWATPASFGAAMAAKDKRVVLLTGEGSHQQTFGAVSSMMRFNVKPVIIVLNNSGYTIERVLSNDPYDKFNDIASWDYTKLPSAFEGESWTAQARTEKEFDEALKEVHENQKSKLCYIEIFTDKMDLPILTRRIMEYKSAKREK